MGDNVTSEADREGRGFIPNLAIDAVIFGFHDNQLKILLVEYKQSGLFALPGGFIRAQENLNDAARRVASERTGLKDIYLEQFYVFGDYSRFDPEPFKNILHLQGKTPATDHWLLQRFISVGYYALVDFTKVKPTPAAIFDSCNWYELNSMPSLIQDHTSIVQKALESLRANLDHKVVGYNLLPENFTMGELQRLYETILGRALLRPAFQRKMLGLGLLQRVAKQYSGKAHKAPYIYTFYAGKNI
jgi:8-oxo-dGTP diphosphatase